MIVLGLRSKDLYDIPSHVSEEQPSPLSEFELEGLEKFIGRKIKGE